MAKANFITRKRKYKRALQELLVLGVFVFVQNGGCHALSIEWLA